MLKLSLEGVNLGHRRIGGGSVGLMRLLGPLSKIGGACCGRIRCISFTLTFAVNVAVILIRVGLENLKLLDFGIHTLFLL